MAPDRTPGSERPGDARRGTAPCTSRAPGTSSKRPRTSAGRAARTSATSASCTRSAPTSRRTACSCALAASGVRSRRGQPPDPHQAGDQGPSQGVARRAQPRPSGRRPRRDLGLRRLRRCLGGSSATARAENPLAGSTTTSVGSGERVPVLTRLDPSSTAGSRPTIRLATRRAISAVVGQLAAQALVGDGEHLDHEQGRVHRPVDGDGGHRDALGHLHGRVERVDAVERAARQRARRRPAASCGRPRPRPGGRPCRRRR